MSTIQNLKDFLRHGKQARNRAGPPPADATTTVSPVHAEQQRFHPPPQQQQPRHAQHFGVSEPGAVQQHGLPHAQAPPADFSVGPGDNRNVAAQAGAAAAQAAAQDQKLHHGAAQAAAGKKDTVDPAVLERIVAEERESKGKLPRYPGLERYQLIEKMGDGAFSNVYRARDLTGEFSEVAVKVVRKFELNNSQVCIDGGRSAYSPFFASSCVACSIFFTPVRPRDTRYGANASE